MAHKATMFRSLFYIISLFTFINTASAQYKVRFTVINHTTGEALTGVSVVGRGDAIHTITDDRGTAWALIKGALPVVFSRIGFSTKELIVSPNSDTSILVQLDTLEKQLEEVIISSTRTDSRIENTPTRVEVLGSEEVEEESGVKPTHVASLLGDVAGIQAQQTSAISGNTDMRIQGLPGSYTQLLRDGMPLFGGYASSFSVLQIPPLDLKQIEIIKGASSTLYGGGAIAGMINIISKKPKLGSPERYMLVNQSTLHESNFNVYISDRDKKRGYTFFGGGTYQKPVDVNNDDFSDLPQTEMVVMHPVFYAYPNEKNTFSIGLNSTFEERRGGDMLVLRNIRDANHQFFILNRSYRNSLDASWEKKITTRDKITIKGIGSWFYRNITTNSFGMKGKQLAWYTEASYVMKRTNHDLVLGLNINGEKFSKKLPDSSFLPNYDHFTLGAFIQDDWRIHSKWTLETGLRTDFHNKYGTFILPRISLLFKASASVTSRLGGGLGYKIPTLFSSDVDERDYRIVRFDPNAAIKAERSYGANWDINVKKKWGEVVLTLNQSFFITRIGHPLTGKTSTSFIDFYNAGKPLLTKGFETWVMLSFGELDAYLGYTLVNAQKKYDAAAPYIELSARNKFASVISYQFSPKFRACLEASYIGPQYLENGGKSPSYPLMAGMVRYDVGRLSFVLNCENLLDYRQTKKEAILVPPYTNPAFRQIWAPIDGRVANLSIRLKL
jgi:outer membrane receptor for ferrienterochelin and colicins